MIGQLNQLSAIWAEAMLRACWQGAVLAGVAWLICRLWRKMPASLAAMIWVFVSLKLLVSTFPPVLALPLLAATPFVSSADQPGNVVDLEVVSRSTQAIAPETLSVQSWIVLSWLAGVAVLAIVVAASIVRLRYKLQNSSLVSDEFLTSTVQTLANHMVLKNIPTIRNSTDQVEVLALDGFRKTILISPSLIDRCSEGEMRLVLAHELAHFKRRDAWLSLIPQLAALLFFFHPLAWLALREFELARESACDEIAVNLVNSTSDSYGRLLVKLGSQPDSIASSLVLGMSSHFKSLSRRIKMLERISTVRNSSRKHYAIVIGVLGALLVAPWSLRPANAALFPVPAQQIPAGKDGFINLGSVKGINYSATNRDIRKVLSDLLGSRVKYSVDADVQGKVTLSVKDVNLEQAVIQAISQVDAGLNYVFNEQAYVIKRAQKNFKVDREGKIDVDVKGAELATLAAKVLRTYGQAYKIGPEVKGAITIRLEKVTMDEALTAILDQAGAKFKQQGGVYIISKDTQPRT